MAYGLKHFADQYPDRIMVSDETTALNCAQFNGRVNQLIGLMRGRGLKTGDAVAVIALNCTDFLSIACASALSGISLVPVNWHFEVEEATYIVENGNAKLMFVDSANLNTAKAVAARTKCSDVVVIGDELDSELEAINADEPNEQLYYASPIFFTSGTTGRPKATRLSQAPTDVRVEEALGRIQENAKLSGMREGFVHMVAGPLYHAGPIGNAVPALLLGGPVYILPKFDPEAALRYIDTYRVTHTLMVPIMFIRLLKLPEAIREQYDVSSLEFVSHIAAPMPPQVKREMIDWWGPKLFDAYGGSEIGVITRISSEEWLNKPGSVGKPISQFSINIVGPEDNVLPVGEIGQIYMISHTAVDLEYIDDPERTAAAHRGPKEFTLGDMGWLDEDGYLYLADRRVDMINSGGVNIYPAEIEAVMHDHPSIEDVAVFGIPNEEWGQEVKAAVQLGSSTEETEEFANELKSWMQGKIATYKIPKTIDFHKELPRFSNGKLHRRVLRDAYWPQ